MSDKHPVPAARARMGWGLALARCAVGVGLSAFLGWLSFTLGVTALAYVVAVFTEQNSGSALNVTVFLGMMGGMIGLPVALLVGPPLWLLVDRNYLISWRSGAVSGAVAGLAIAILIPVFVPVLVAAGTIAGGLAVHLTNRWLPKPAAVADVETQSPR